MMVTNFAGPRHIEFEVSGIKCQISYTERTEAPVRFGNLQLQMEQECTLSGNQLRLYRKFEEFYRENPADRSNETLGIVGSYARAANEYTEIPDKIYQVIEYCRHGMQDIVQSRTKYLRWRLDLDFDLESKTRLGVLEWRAGDDDWFPCPVLTQWNVTVGPTVSLHGQRGNDCMDALRSLPTEEPVAHELLWEAKRVAEVSPRSALILAISSVELRISESQVFQEPSRKWFRQQRSSARSEDILRDLLPLVIDPPYIGSGDVPIPQEIITHFKLVSGLRNQLAHPKNAVTLSNEQVRMYLHVCEDLLYFLDYYDGYEWAEDTLWSVLQHGVKHRY